MRRKTDQVISVSRNSVAIVIGGNYEAVYGTAVVEIIFAGQAEILIQVVIYLHRGEINISQLIRAHGRKVKAVSFSVVSNGCHTVSHNSKWLLTNRKLCIFCSPRNIFNCINLIGRPVNKVLILFRETHQNVTEVS